MNCWKARCYPAWLPSTPPDQRLKPGTSGLWHRACCLCAPEAPVGSELFYMRPVVLLEGPPGLFHFPTARLQGIGGCCGIDAQLLALEQLLATLIVVLGPGFAGLQQSLALLRGEITLRCGRRSHRDQRRRQGGCQGEGGGGDAHGSIFEIALNLATSLDQDLNALP